MLYCPKCHVLCEEQCPVCGNRKLVEPQAEEPARLATVKEPNASALEEQLRQTQIPYEKRAALSADGDGAAFNFYVPCCRFQEGVNAMQAACAEDQTKDAPDAEPPIDAKPKPQTYRVGGEEFEVMPRKKQIFWRIFSIVMLIAVVFAVILLSDMAAGWVKRLFA